MTRDPDRVPTDIRCALTLGAGRVVLSGWPGLRIAVSGAAWIDPQAAAATLQELGQLGATHLVALCQAGDLPPQSLPLLRRWSRGRGQRLVHAPLRDFQPPDGPFLRLWRTLGPRLHRELAGGAAVGLACSYGAGRSGTIAALMLHEQGWPMPDAIGHVRAGFPAAIESKAQLRWLMERPSAAARQGHWLQ